jgi:DNA polymerase-3 subunit delta'
VSDKADSRAVRAELERALASGQVHGAYLFHGPPGTGKRATAFWLAERLLGLSPRDDGEEARHPDLHVVEPDGAVLKIEQVRALQGRLSLVANEGGHRVGLIFGAERLNKNAANALLKTLEEPPRSTTLVLTTSAASTLPPTVRSRTTHYRFTPRPASAIQARLVEQGFEAEDAWLSAELGGGSVEAARGWADEHLEEAREIAAGLRAIPGGTASDALDFAESFRGGAAMRARAELCLAVWGVLVRRQVERTAKSGDRAALELWLGRAEAGLRARRELAIRNLNPQLVVEELALDLSRA